MISQPLHENFDFRKQVRTRCGTRSSGTGRPSKGNINTELFETSRHIVKNTVSKRYDFHQTPERKKLDTRYITFCINTYLLSGNWEQTQEPNYVFIPRGQFFECFKKTLLRLRGLKGEAGELRKNNENLTQDTDTSTTKST